MTEATILDLGNNALMAMLTLGVPVLVVTSLVGLAVSIFQATTQIHEMTLTFVPKIAVTFILMVVAGPWMISTMLTYTTNLFLSLPSLGH